MCKNLLFVKPKNEYNIKKAFIPCGKCEECRTMQKAEWTNRLLIDMDYYQKKKGYKVGFITLTYNEEHLPHIPKRFLVNENDKIPCFNYEHVKKLNNTLRKYLHTKYGLKDGYRYFITCEYGEQYHRPHMHGIMVFNPIFDHWQFYQLIQDAWTGSTNYIQNNEKRKTKRPNYGFISTFKDFVPTDTHKCGAYVAKYVCKDIEFENYTTEKIKPLTGKLKNELRHYSPFHKQSIGLSRCLLNDKNIMEKLENGVSVMGSRDNKELPNYIKDRLLYTKYNTYNLNKHKHEQTRLYTKENFENKLKVYTKKYEQNKMLFKKLQTKEYWDSKQTNYEIKKNAIEDITNITNKINTDKLAKFYTTYYGLEYEKCFEGKPEELLFMRHNPCNTTEKMSLIDRNYYEQMKTACEILIGYAHINDKFKRRQTQEITDKIKAFWTNYQK